MPTEYRTFEDPAAFLQYVETQCTQRRRQRCVVGAIFAIVTAGYAYQSFIAGHRGGDLELQQAQEEARFIVLSNSEEASSPGDMIFKVDSAQELYDSAWQQGAIPAPCISLNAKDGVELMPSGGQRVKLVGADDPALHFEGGTKRPTPQIVDLKESFAGTLNGIAFQRCSPAASSVSLGIQVARDSAMPL